MRADAGRRIQQLEDAFGGGHGPLQNVVLLAEILDGTEEAQPVLQERHHHAQRQGAALDAEAAISQDAGQRQHRQKLHYRIEPAIGQDGVLVGVHMLAVDAVELLTAFGFPVKKLQDHNSGYVLLQIGVDLGDGDADAPVALGHATPEYGGDQDHQRHHSQHQNGQSKA